MIEKNIRLQPHHARDLLVGRRSDGRRPGYQPPGGGATSLGSGRDVSGGGGGGGGEGGGGHAAQAAAAQHAARQRAAAEAAAAQQAAAQQAAAQRAMQATIAQAERAEVERQESDRANQLAEARRLMTQPTSVDVPIKGPELIPGTTGPVKLDPYQQNYISPGRVDIKDRYQTGDYADLVQGPIDVGFQNIIRKQEIAEDLRQKQQDPDYGQFFRPQPVVEKPSGIMSKIGGMGKKVFGETPLDWALTLGTAGGSKLAGGIKMAQRYFPKQFGDIKTALTSNLRSTIDKGTDLRSRPKGMPEHLGETGFKTRDETPTRDGENVNIQAAITGDKGLLTEGAETLGITEDQRKQYLLMQNKMKTALGQGSYTNEQGQVIQLNEQQLNQLQNYLDKLDNILQTTLQSVAHGGRIDSPLTGGSRYI